jgi:tetratricopeptide (TPR) repeat protein
VQEENTLKQDALFLEGESKKILGNEEEATGIFERYVRQFPEDGAGYYELARLKLAQNSFDEVIPLMKKAVQLEPNNKYYRLFYAKILSMSGELGKAEKEYDEYIQGFETQMSVYKQYINLLVRENKIRKGIEVLDRLEGKIGISKEISMQKRDLYMMQGELKKATHEILKLSQAFPQDISYMFILSDLYVSDNQDQKAFEIYRKILRIDPSNPYVHISISDYYRKKIQVDSAFYHIEQGFGNPQLGIDDKMHILIALMAEDNNIALLRKLAKILTRVHPQEAKAHSILGDIHYQMLDLASADSSYRKALDIDPNRYPIWEQILFIDNDLRKREQAIKDAKNTIELFPEMPIPYLILGSTYLFLKKPHEAVKYLEQGKDWSSNKIDLSIQFNTYLGDAYQELGNYQSSEEAYETVLLLDPENVYVLNNYAYFLSLRNQKLEQARKMGAKVVKLKPLNSNYLDTYAWVLYRLQEYEEAEKIIEKSLRYEGKDNPVIVEHYGDILWKLNKKEDAVKQWERADSLGKASSFLKKKISEKQLFE